jgi:hypothetical protein
VRDNLRRRGLHRCQYRIAVQPVHHDGNGPRGGLVRRVARGPGGGGDLVTVRDQSWDQVPADRGGATRDEHSHVTLLA